jgi:hypothetical protein
MHNAATRLVLLILLPVACLTVGCASPPVSASGSYQQTAEPARPPEQGSVPMQQQIDQFYGSGQSSALPVGQVPPVVVGRWSGGENYGTKEYLIIAQDGSYARGKDGQYPYEAGVIISSGQRFVTVGADGSQHAGEWSYQNAAGIEVLGIYFDSHYYSYTRV